MTEQGNIFPAAYATMPMDENMQVCYYNWYFSFLNDQSFFPFLQNIAMDRRNEKRFTYLWSSTIIQTKLTIIVFGFQTKTISTKLVANFLTLFPNFFQAFFWSKEQFSFLFTFLYIEFYLVTKYSIQYTRRIFFLLNYYLSLYI